MPHTVPVGHTAGLFITRTSCSLHCPLAALIVSKPVFHSCIHDGDCHPHASVIGVLISVMIVVHIVSLQQSHQLLETHV